MLTSSHKDFKNIQHIAEEITERQGAGSCFLLDSYDEWYDDDYVYDLAFRDKLKFSVCILTARPYNIKADHGLKHVEIVGFEDENLDHFLATLSTNHSVTQSVLDLWSEYPHVREMCTLPLHLPMVIFIIKYESSLRIQTRAQIYTAFMNATIKHYRESHRLDWNTISLRHCVKSSTVDDLCTAFQTLHFVAFEMLFQHTLLFSKNLKVQKNVKSLGFVDVKMEPSTSDLVRYTFSHPTFLEFFAVLHLTTLSPSKQLIYINLYGRECNNNLVTLLFELTNDLYPDNVLAVGTFLKRFATQWNNKQPFATVCRFTYNATFLKTVETVTRGWSHNAHSNLLKTAGIVVNSSLCVHDTEDHNLIKDVLKHTTVHSLHLKGRNYCMNYSITVEDWSQSLTGKHLDIMHLCLGGKVHHCALLSSVKALSVKIQESQTCILQIFNILNNYLPQSSLFQIDISNGNIFVLQDVMNSLKNMSSEVILTIDTCQLILLYICLLYTSPSPRDATLSRMPSSA